MIILLRILAFKCSNNRVYMNEKISTRIKERFSREYHVVCDGKQTTQAKKVYF